MSSLNLTVLIKTLQYYRVEPEPTQRPGCITMSACKALSKKWVVAATEKEKDLAIAKKAATAARAASRQVQININTKRGARKTQRRKHASNNDSTGFRTSGTTPVGRLIQPKSSRKGSALQKSIAKRRRSQERIIAQRRLSTIKEGRPANSTMKNKSVNRN